jgi:hypothetical protein
MAMKLPKRPEGYKRAFSKCLDCGKPQFSDYIPFGLGHGHRYNQCLCQLTSNRTHRLKKITRAEYERLTRVWVEKMRVATIRLEIKTIDEAVNKALDGKAALVKKILSGRTR